MAKATKKRKAGAGNPFLIRPRDRQKPLARSEENLRPNRESQNLSPVQAQPAARSAADIDNLIHRLTGFDANELTQIPIVPAGTQLKQGAVYLDLRDPAPVPFTATAGIIAEEHNYYTPEAEVPRKYWSKLVQTLAPARVASRSSSAVQPFSPQAAASESAPAVKQPAAEGARSLGASTIPESLIDETIEETFPASDPPSWTTGTEKNRGRRNQRPR